jgi:type I restriction enzyme S subunit
VAPRSLGMADRPEGLSDGAKSTVAWAPISSRLLTRGQRRMEASTFLTDGFGLRQSLETLSSTVRLSEVADVWQPSRLKGFVVKEGKGLPFLSAGQVFESQPRVRKWLAEAMVPAPETRYVDPEWLLLSCSGEVGRLTAVYPEHVGKVITHDLLRIVPADQANYGWLYAYMRTPTFHAVAVSSEYGHMIKHLEPEHVLQMPVAMPDKASRLRIGSDAEAALQKRRDARQLYSKADQMFADLVNPLRLTPSASAHQAVSSSEVVAGRRRLEAQFHRADVEDIERLVKTSALRCDKLASVVESITMASRFKRYFGSNGAPYRSAGELFDVNAPLTKRIYSGLLDNAQTYMLRAGEMVMARSGQTYGLLGRTLVLTENHEGTFGSEDLIRIVPDQAKARTGYLQTVLSHVDYGRPRVVRYASGTSVPHLDPPDIRDVLIPRFDDAAEAQIADLTDEAIRLSSEADRLESAAVEAAERLIEELRGSHGVPQLLVVS